jgi:putative flavoprotein involved in K+ transport
MAEHVDTIVIGAGQAGLATSYHLTQQGQNHLVLEKARVGEAWRSGRWDSFTLVTPNWALRLPGFAYQGESPNGFLGREEVIRYLEDYVRLFNPPLRLGVEVSAVRAAGDGFTVETSDGDLYAHNVVVASGSFQQPKIPSFAAQIAPHIVQLHSSQYRNPQQLPAGAVLIVGSGQSGCQIADELCQEGRKTYLSGGKVGSLPRRYRGHDGFWWAEKFGMLDRHVSKLPSPAARFAANPQITGRDGGRALDLHRLAAAGVTLLGRTLGANGTKLTFAMDLHDNLAYADKFLAELMEALDKFIAESGIDAPPHNDPPVRKGYDSPMIPELDLDAAGITSIIWASGYRFDFSWIDFPIYDDYGYPFQERGVTAQPGLYFVGLQWLNTPKSSLLIGVGEDAAHVATDIVRRGERVMS